MLKTPQLIMLECVPGKIRKSLQLDTSALYCGRRAKGMLWICQFADEAAIGLAKEEQGNTADGKRKMQGYKLKTEDRANFHCRFFLYFIPFFSFQFRCVSCSPILVLRIDCCIHGRLLA